MQQLPDVAFFGIGVCPMFLSILLSSLSAQAEESVAPSVDQPSSDIPRHRVYYESLAALRYNPLGMQQRMTIGYRMRLMDKPSDDLLFGDSYAWLGVTGIQTPAYMRVGPWARIMPIALLRLQAGYEVARYNGGLDQMLTWDDPSNVDFSDAGIETLAADGTLKAMGSVFTLEARLQAKAGPVAVRATLARYDYSYAVDGFAFYDQTLDILAPTDGVVTMGDFDLLYVATDQVTVGARSSHTRSQAEFAANDSEALRAASIDRTGVLVAYKFKSDLGSRFDQPTVYMISQWHINHEYRAGQEVNRAVPYVAVGFAFTGDAIAWEPQR
jgi:hypothetical protein